MDLSTTKIKHRKKRRVLLLIVCLLSRFLQSGSVLCENDPQHGPLDLGQLYTVPIKESFEIYERPFFNNSNVLNVYKPDIPPLKGYDPDKAYYFKTGFKLLAEKKNLAKISDDLWRNSGIKERDQQKERDRARRDISIAMMKSREESLTFKWKAEIPADRMTDFIFDNRQWHPDNKIDHGRFCRDYNTHLHSRVLSAMLFENRKMPDQPFRVPGRHFPCC